MGLGKLKNLKRNYRKIDYKLIIILVRNYSKEILSNNLQKLLNNNP